MECKNFEQLIAGCKAFDKKTIAVAAAHDEHTLCAIKQAADEIGISYVLVGDKERITAIAAEIGLTVSEDTIIDAVENAECAEKAVALVREGRADVLMKGILETSTLLKAVLNKEKGIRSSSVMSHLTILEIPAYHKLLGISDGGMNTYPTLEQKAGIVKNAVDFWMGLGLSAPKVAALAAVETISDKMPETIEAAELMKMAKEGLLGDCELEGPLSFDIAIDRESAEIKRFSSAISGDTDIFLMPNIASGNIVVKALIHWAGAKNAGVVIGAKVPIVLVSRGASAEEKFLSIAVSAMV